MTLKKERLNDCNAMWELSDIYILSVVGHKKHRREKIDSLEESPHHFITFHVNACNLIRMLLFQSIHHQVLHRSNHSVLTKVPPSVLLA